MLTAHLRRFTHNLEQSPLRAAGFRNLWLGLLISHFGDQFTVIALLWLVLQLTGSGLALGSVIVSFALPRIISAPLWGRALDRGSPRLVMVIDNLARALFIGAIPLAYWFGFASLAWIVVMAMLAGAFAPATEVGVRVIAPRMVRDDELDQANGLLAATQQIAVLLGPALAGALTAVAGAPAALLIDSLSFVLMAVLLMGVPAISRPHAAPQGSTAPSVFSGFQLLWNNVPVRVLTFLIFVLALSYYPLEPALPVFARDVLKRDASAYGALWSSFGVGALLSYLSIGWLKRMPQAGIVMALIAMAWGAVMIPIWFVHSLPVALLCFALGGLAWGPYMPLESSLIQRLVPAHQLGAVFGARSAIVNITNPLGVLLGGWFLGWMDASTVIGISALAVLLAGALALASPGLRGLRRSA